MGSRGDDAFPGPCKDAGVLAGAFAGRIQDELIVWHSLKLHVCVYATTIRNECDYYPGAVFQGGGEGHAEAVSRLFCRAPKISIGTAAVMKLCA